MMGKAYSPISYAVIVGLLLSLWGFINMSNANTAELTLQDISVSGMGWKTNRKLKEALALVMSDETQTATINRTFIEDTFWVLDSEVRRRGYLEPQFEAKLSTPDGEKTRLTPVNTDGIFDVPAFPDNNWNHVELLVSPGQLSYYNSIQIAGSGMGDKVIQSFFHPVNQLIINKESRYYTPARFNGGLQDILSTLQEQGYRNAKIESRNADIDKSTGAVNVQATFQRGKINRCGDIRFEVVGLEDASTTQSETIPTPPTAEECGKLLNPSWVSNYIFSVRSYYFKRGYVDVQVSAAFKEVNSDEDSVNVDIVITVELGQQKQVGNVTVAGSERTLPKLLNRQITLKEGQPLDPVEIDKSRDRLYRLGVFESIETDTTDPTPQTRDITFNVEPLPTDTVNLIMGVGSYDILRGGIEWERRNILGRAHKGKLDALQSLKMTQAGYTYSIPQFLGINVEAFARADLLAREEISFNREEFGGSLGLTYFWRRHNTQLTALYSFHDVSVSGQSFNPQDGIEDTTVSSFTVKARKTDLDNPIYPSKGYQLFSILELALPEIGGDVQYQSLEFGAAIHSPLYKGLIGHLNLRHGIISSFSDASENIPFTRRFLMGGENTVRGYRQGQASPADATGKVIGAESYTLIQFGVEQKINETLSWVIFSDTVGISEESSEYLSPDWLSTIGTGLRIRTIIGPLRFEYGHNLNPRPFDPPGAFQFSLGMPY